MNSTVLKFLILLAAIVVFAGSGCAPLKVDSKPVDPKPVDPRHEQMAADPEAATILSRIDKAPAPTGYNQLAALYMRRARSTGDFSLNAKAEEAVKKARAAAPDDVTARKFEASLALTFHRFSEALELGQKLQADLPDDAFVYGVLTDANVELGNYEAAIDAGQRMIDLKPNMASYARVGHLRSLHGDTNGAIQQYTLAARTADPMDKEAQSWCLTQLGDELFKSGDYPKAEKVYDEALQNFPKYYLSLAGKGRVRAAQGDLDATERILSEMNTRIPNVENTVLLGDVYSKIGDPEKAQEQYELVEIIEQKLGVKNDQKRLALMWADHGIKLDEALAIAKGEYAERTDIFTADVLAWCLYKTGNLTDAKTAISAAMRLKTKDARILYHAGMIERGLGNASEALRLLSLALNLNPAFDIIQADSAKQALSELKFAKR